MATKQVQTTCPYCGAGCQIMFTVDPDANKIVGAVPADGRTNQGKLCLKGHYGWDYLNDPQILTKRLRHPMIRKNGKGSPLEVVSWDEAVKFVAGRREIVSISCAVVSRSYRRQALCNQGEIRTGFHHVHGMCARLR